MSPLVFFEGASYNKYLMHAFSVTDVIEESNISYTRKAAACGAKCKTMAGFAV